MGRLARLMVRAACAALGLWPLAARAEESVFRLKTEPPEGFEALLVARELSAAVFLDGEQLGVFDIDDRFGVLTFREPDAVFATLPPVTDPGPVMTALRGELATNAGLSCLPSPRAGCGRLQTDSVAVIYAREAERIDLFLAGSLRATAAPYLAEPEKRFTAAGALDLSFSFVDDQFALNGSPQAVFGYGRTHIAVAGNAHEDGWSLDTAYWRLVGRAQTTTIGLQSAGGFSFIYPDRLVGVRVASETQTRRDRTRMADTPLMFDAPLPGRVEVRRDGRVLASQAIQPGVVVIDTSALPEGAYPVRLRILDASGERSEQRLFSRGPGLAPLGGPTYFAEFGAYAPLQLAASGGKGQSWAPRLTTSVARFGVDMRVAPQASLSGRLEGSEQRQLIELGGVFFADGWRANAVAAGTQAGERAGALTLSGAGRTFAWGLDGRWVQSGEGALGEASRGLGSRYTQAGVNLAWRDEQTSLAIAGFWRRERSGSESYSVLPSARINLGQSTRGSWSVDFSGEASRDQWAVRVGLSFSRNVSGRGVSMSGGVETADRGGRKTNLPYGSFDANINQQRGDSALTWRAGFTRRNETDVVRTGVTTNTPAFLASADAQWTRGDPIVFGRFSTLAGFDGRRFALGSGGFTGAGLIARVDGAAPEERFALRAPGAGGRAIRAGRSQFVPVGPFQEGDVSLDATAGASRFTQGSGRVTFYPGTVASVQRAATQTVIVYARLIDRLGRAIPEASLRGIVGAAQTDLEGYFTIETAMQDNLQADVGGGRRCTASLAVAPRAAPVVSFGDLICRQTQ